jgi:polysaccharide deacetylase family protein (PEP-CTERM system associated)
MSVDVEDYFQVEAFSGAVSRDTWEQFPLRVNDNTRRVLDLFDEAGIKATFFFVGWVAEKFPDLVKETARRGHELGCHSYWHRLIYSLEPEEFRSDTRRARDVIEQAGGARVLGYRAPSWSITRQSLWALDILAEEGFTYDSSIYPIHHDIYGVPGAKKFPYEYECSNGRKLPEFPPATVNIAGTTLPAAGGGYLRIFPMAFTHYAFRQYARSYGKPLVVYFHPWEIDPGQPRIQAGVRSRLRHYTNLRKMESRLRNLLATYSFHPFREEPAVAEALSVSRSVRTSDGRK